MDYILRLEHEIDQLQENILNIQIIPQKIKKDYLIDIILPPLPETKDFFNNPISFALYIKGDKYPYTAPMLFCTTNFCFPSIADGRDILRDVFKSQWTPNSKLVFILDLLPEFIKNFVKLPDTLFLGKYYLGEKYDLKLLKKCKFEVSAKIKENVIVKGKWTKYTRVLFLSDIYFLLFEPERWSGKLTLVFWGSINTILMVKKILINKMVFINWKQKGTDTPYEMSLYMENSNIIVENILERMNYFGINYSATKEVKGLPPTNIEQKEKNTPKVPGLNYIEHMGNMSARSIDSGREDNFNIGRVEEDIKRMTANKEKEKNKEELRKINESLGDLYLTALKYYEPKDNKLYEKYKTLRETILKEIENENKTESNSTIDNEAPITREDK